MNGNDTFLDVNNAHLRVTSGNVYASAFNLDQIDIVMSSNTASTVNFNNPTKAFNAASNIEVGTANLFVDTTTSNVGIGTDTPLDTLHINGGTRFAGHIIPTTNATFDIGEPENKIRDIYVDTNSLWIGDLTKIAFERGKMKFKRRKINKVPTALVTLATSHVSELNTEAEVQADAVTFAQTIDNTISTVEDLKLEHWRDYAKRFDETKAVSDIFIDNDEDYEAVTASEAFMEVESNIFTEHSLSIGKTTDPTAALDVVGTVKATAFEGDGSALTGIVSGQWTESGGDIYRSSGNVGVGTDSPAKTLHVAGTMRISNATTNTETTDIVKIAGVNTTTTTSAPHAGWSQEQKLLAYQPSFYDYFGQQSAVSGDGNTICVGARTEDTTAVDSGAVYVYTYGSGTWTYRARLKASDAQASDILGEAGLAISDDGRTIVVAARYEDTGGTNAGAAYVFMSSNSTWTSFTQQKLQASNKAADDQFCRCDVSGDGNTIIVGAPHEDGPTNSVASSGAAYIYSRSGNSWSEDQILYPSDPVVNNYFGVDNALNENGTVAAIASTGDDTSATDSGAVYIFTKSNGTWSQETKLKITSGGPNASDYWGGVSLSDDGLTLSAGTSNDDTTASNSGAVYVFNKSGGTWSQTVKLKASNAGENDKLGGRTRISGTGNTIVSGAREEDTGINNAGSAYIFTLNNGTWTQRQQIQASDRASSDLFGDSVGISKDGTVICVGAVLEDGGGADSGSVYAFRGYGGGTTTTTTTIPSSLKINDTIVATAFEGDGSALTGIVSGQWTESGGDIYRSSGNIGIGTTDPNYKLHAYTNTTGTNLMELEHDGSTLSGGPSGTNYWMQFKYGGRVGMTIKAPDNSVNTPVTFASNNALKFMVDSTEPLTLDHLGNVGINKALPDRNFHVVGTSRFDGDFEWYKVGQRTSHANYGSNRDWYIRSGSTAGKVVIQDGGGSVGIGTSSPESILHVQHTTTNNAFIKVNRHNEPSSTKAIFAVSEYQMTGETSPGTIIGNHNRSIHIGPVFEAGNTVGSTDIRGIHIKSTGDVGIGTTSPSTDLQIGNTSTKTSDTYLTIASDGGSAYAQGIRLIHHGTDTSSMYGWRIRGDDTDDCFHINYINQGSHQTSALTINNDGIITTPKRPAFYAWDNSTSRSGTTLTFNSTTYNIGSHYNTSTSRFKTPVAGTYIFAAVLAHDTANEFGDAYFSFYVDNVHARDILEGMPIHDSHYETHAVFIVNLNANQYVDIRSRSGTNITFINGNHGAYYRNCFQGALLG